MAGRRAAEAVRAARAQAKLSQRELAERAGTTQSAIARLEDDLYCGHTLKALGRVADALGLRVEVRFVPARPVPPRKE